MIPKLVNGKPVVNPDESLAELLHRRTHARNSLTWSKQVLEGAKTEYEYDKQGLADIEKKIAEVEKAAATGGVVRLI